MSLPAASWINLWEMGEVSHSCLRKIFAIQFGFSPAFGLKITCPCALGAAAVGHEGLCLWAEQFPAVSKRMSKGKSCNPLQKGLVMSFDINKSLVFQIDEDSLAFVLLKHDAPL